ncbi:hypothetical protein MKX03_027727 [Papaver bracteatum]|nr:hypothetical protein MKX03_027727 [Papaver bracteatum]
MNSTETGFAICHSILSFDVRNEAFNLDLRKPEYLDRYYFPKFGICVLGDRLCMFFEMILGSEHCLDVWVMKEYGVRESWSKLCAVVTNKLHEVEDESPVIPIHILKNGEFLLEKDGDQKTLVLYDPVHSSARVLEINGVPNWLGTETCLESIVSPKLGNHTGAEEHLQE